MVCFSLPPCVIHFLTQNDNPRTIGHGLGTMLYHISPLVITHLENSVSHANAPSSALAWAPQYITAVDAYIATMRRTDSLFSAFPKFPTCRKERAKKARVAKGCTAHVEAAFKECVRGALRDLFNAWGKRDTQLFNKGIDKALSGIQWVVYPGQNVVLEAGDEEWAMWLRRMGENLALVEVKAGRQGLEDV